MVSTVGHDVEQLKIVQTSSQRDFGVWFSGFRNKMKRARKMTVFAGYLESVGELVWTIFRSAEIQLLVKIIGRGYLKILVNLLLDPNSKIAEFAKRQGDKKI